jgi:chromosome segregation ATPase
MKTRSYMADIAGHELKLLIHDTRTAIQSLDRQRDSALQAVEAAQAENGHVAEASDEENLAVDSLIERLSQLQAVLDNALREMDAIQQAAQPVPASEEYIAWPLWAKRPARQRELVRTNSDA